MVVPVSARVAAVLLWVSALGLGSPCLMAIRNLLVGRGIPIVLGFPAYGSGPFERHGLPTTVALLSGFLLVCLLEGAAGGLLWSGLRRGALLAVFLLIPGGLYWWGFALPYPPILALLRTVLILFSWSGLK